MEVIPIDSPQLTVFALSGVAWPCLVVAHIYIYMCIYKRIMKMANSPENGLVSAVP